MPVVEELDVALTNVTHRQRKRFWPGRCQQQVDMVVHQDEGMDGDGVFGAGLTQQPSVMVEIFVVDENSRAIDAALGYMERDIRQDQACAAWHGGRPLDAISQCLSRQRCTKSEKKCLGRRKDRLIASVPFSLTSPSTTRPANAGLVLCGIGLISSVPFSLERGGKRIS